MVIYLKILNISASEKWTWEGLVWLMWQGEEYKLYLQSWEENSCEWQKSGPRDECSQIALKHFHIHWLFTPSLTYQVPSFIYNTSYYLSPAWTVEYVAIANGCIKGRARMLSKIFVNYISVSWNPRFYSFLKSFDGFCRVVQGVTI